MKDEELRLRDHDPAELAFYSKATTEMCIRDREKIETGYFEELIQKYLLDNSHKSYVSIEPEKGLNARLEKELEEKLAAYKKDLSEEEIDKLSLIHI